MIGALTSLALTGARRRLRRLRLDPRGCQDDVARRLAATFADTKMGRALGLAGVRSADDLRKAAPIRTFEEQKDLFERPLYWGITTGSTGGEKAVPFTRALIDVNASCWELFLASALLECGSLAPALGKVFFLGSCTPLKVGEDGVPRGSGTTIAVRERPPYFRRKAIPGNELDDLPSWAEKMDRLVDMARKADVRVALGMPPWLLSFCEHAEKRLGTKSLRAMWPNLRVVMSGGTFLAPYRARLEERLGPALFREMYSATEGFFGFQDGADPGMLPLADSIFLELVPMDDWGSASPRRLLLHEAETGAEYAVVLSSFAGLFAYPVGDTVRFVSRAPLRFVVSGRTRQRASVAGEKVTIEEIEGAALDAAKALGMAIAEVAVVPMPPERSADGKPRHAWYLEVRGEGAGGADACAMNTRNTSTTGTPPAAAREPSPEALAAALDRALAARSATYRVRREGDTPALGPPTARLLEPGTFERFLARTGKVGAHNKVPRVLAEAPAEFVGRMDAW